MTTKRQQIPTRQRSYCQKEAKTPCERVNCLLLIAIVWRVWILKHILVSKLTNIYLTWKEHVNQTAKKISRNIALLRRIRGYLPDQTRITFYKANIHYPDIDYCNTVGQSTHVPRIHILHKMALIIIMNVPKFTYSAPFFALCGVMPNQTIVKFRMVRMVYKTLKGLNPLYMSDMFKSVFIPAY